MSAATVPALDADLTAGLRRLKLAAMRQLAPELLVTAKTQRWTPEEVLRALVEAALCALVSATVRPAVGPLVGSAVCALVRACVSSPVETALGTLVRARIGAAVKAA